MQSDTPERRTKRYDGLVSNKFLAKHFFNDPTHLVSSALRSLTLTNPSLAFDEENKIIYRRPTGDASTQPKVSIISGGGSGHEPAFAGFVGKGLLTASVAGTIFASPSAEQVRRAVMQRVEVSKGVLIIIMNYTGDVLNFGMAAEKAKAAGIKTEFFAVGDDVGVGRTKGGKVGRRGIGGGILVLKIIGALAEAGGFAERSICDCKTGCKECYQDDTDRGFLKWDSPDKFVLFINNLGGVSTLELSGITAETILQLERDYHIKPVRTIQGTFLTSLNGMGFSISLLRLVDTRLGQGRSLLELLDAPAEAVGWAAPIQTSTWESQSDATFEGRRASSVQEAPSNLKGKSGTHESNHIPTNQLTVNISVFKKAVVSGLNRLIAAESTLTRYDTIVGDGDCGVGLKRGAEAIVSLLNNPSVPLNDDILRSLNRIISLVETTMDGTSGAIYAIFLNALAHGLREQDSPSNSISVTAKVWSRALQQSLKALAKYTPAQPGDRTLIDALVPFINKLTESGDVKAAARAAQEGAESTKSMKASLGRSVYIGGEDEWIGKIPDPGAYGLSEFLNGLADGI
ncbi:dihydroxyacetone kinase [Coccidioides immitis H538.4]|uniref:Dihydroxyacetone kinase n=1 Tax=Coccidioides immitis H538.4 TaxID=396776 RepID=A0A0J8RY71_COCIT|nr:dihydroxyacetone kinase [Coccidioides immitis H538.4]